MKQGSLTINYLYNVAYKVLTLITPLITTPYISRILGVENIGIYNYTFSVVSYFILFGILGFQMYGQREIAYSYNDQEKLNNIFWEIFWSRLFCVNISLFIFLVYVSKTEYYFLYSIFVLEIIANAIDISWFFYGTENFKTITIRNFIVKLIGVACIFLFVKNKEHLSVYIFWNVFVLLVGNICLWPSLKGKISKRLLPNRNCIIHLKLAIIFFIPQCIDSVYMLMDKVMLGNLSTMTQVGLYGQADKIIKMVVTIITSMGLVVSPRIAQCFSNGDQTGLKKYMLQSIQFIFSFGFPMIFGLAGIASSFSLWFFGSEYNGVDQLIIMLTPVILFMGMNSVLGWQYLMTVKKEKKFIFSVSVGAIVNFILNMILISKYEAFGAAFASVMSMCVMTIINLYFVREMISVSVVLFYIWKPLLASIFMWIGVSRILLILPYTAISTFVEIGAGVCIFLFFEWILKDTIVTNFIISIIDKIKR